MRRRWIGGLLAAALIGMMGIPAWAQAFGQTGLDAFEKTKEYQPGQFSDVAQEDWFSDNVEAAFRYGLMVGQGEALFAPDGSVTVAEAITIAARLHKMHETGTDDFSQGSPWYQSYLDYARRQGLTVLWMNEDALQAALHKPCNRSYLVELIGLALPDELFPEINQVEADAILDLWSYLPHDQVYLMYRAGVLTGKDTARNFGPADHVHRSEMAAILTRVVDTDLRVAFTLEVPDYPEKNQWLAPGTYGVGPDISKGLYYVLPEAGGPVSYEVYRYGASGVKQTVSSNSKITAYDFIYIHNTEHFAFKSGAAILAENIPPIEPVDGRYGDGKYRIGVDIPAGACTLYAKEEGKRAEYAIFSGARGQSQGGLMDSSSVIGLDYWDSGTREVNLPKGHILSLDGSYLLAQ